MDRGWNSSRGPSTYEVNGGNKDQDGSTISGTYVCKDLILDIASWISPAFYLRCSRIVNDFFIPKNQEIVNDPEELNKVLKQLEELRLENEVKDETIQELRQESLDKDDKIGSLEALIKENEKKASEERQQLHRQMLSLGIDLSELKERNDDLNDKLDEATSEITNVEKKVVSVQKKLNIAVEDRAPQPDSKAHRERFILLRSNEMDLPFQAGASRRPRTGEARSSHSCSRSWSPKDPQALPSSLFGCCGARGPVVPSQQQDLLQQGQRGPEAAWCPDALQ